MLIDGLHGYLFKNFIMTYWNFTVTYEEFLIDLCTSKSKELCGFLNFCNQAILSVVNCDGILVIVPMAEVKRFFSFSGRKLLHCRKESGIVTAYGDCFLWLRGALLVPLQVVPPEVRTERGCIKCTLFVVRRVSK